MERKFVVSVSVDCNANQDTDFIGYLKIEKKEESTIPPCVVPLVKATVFNSISEIWNYTDKLVKENKMLNFTIKEVQ
jgi:hypothetical protein